MSAERSIDGEFSVERGSAGTFILELEAGGLAYRWQFPRCSSAYRFLTEEMAVDSTEAAHLLHTAAGRPRMPIELTPHQWQRLRGLHSRA